MTDPGPRFLICISNQGYAASLEVRKVYENVEDTDAAREGLVRVIDESGEDYLFPDTMFLPIELSGALRDAILRAS
jgi:hypothetical protein